MSITAGFTRRAVATARFCAEVHRDIRDHGPAVCS
jgi:hypothetical protein